MCGISGAYLLNNSCINKELVVKMTNALTHRGPDEESYYFEENQKLGLGHRRLSIIDYTGGHQPIFNENENFVLIFNGEIYNFQELQKGLKEKGHTFKTNSDTEVIIHLYEEQGIDCLKRLRGMFAFAIWDKEKEELFIARDRIGKKPLYYACSNNKFYFSSEIQSLYLVPDIPKSIDYSSLDLFFTHSYIPSPQSIYKDIKKLPPAHYLKINKESFLINRYWYPEYNQKLKISYDEAKEELLRILHESVKLRLISDVPLGAFLSGGTDSSAIVALMSQLSNTKVKTFSIGFSNKKYNELPYARMVVDKYKTEHQEFIVEPNLLEILPEIIQQYGEPYGDSSAIPTWYLSQLTRQYVTVALNGDGGDELFGGYNWYPLLHKLNNVTKFLRPSTSQFIHTTCKNLLPRKIIKAFKIMSETEAGRFQMLRSFITANDRNNLYHNDFQKLLTKDSNKYLEQLYDNSLTNDYDRYFKTDLLSYLPEDLLVKVDRASMAHSLECRSPLLDQELVEFSCKLPSKWKTNNKMSKIILKDAVKGLLPDGFMNRPKMGFSMPIKEWFRGELKSYIKEKLLNGPLIQMPLLKQTSLENLLEEHFSAKRNHESLIWNFLMFSLWHETYN